jgi:hypothetical protein
MMFQKFSKFHKFSWGIYDIVEVRDYTLDFWNNQATFDTEIDAWVEMRVLVAVVWLLIHSKLEWFLCALKRWILNVQMNHIAI